MCRCNEPIKVKTLSEERGHWLYNTAISVCMCVFVRFLIPGRDASGHRRFFWYHVHDVLTMERRCEDIYHKMC